MVSLASAAVGLTSQEKATRARALQDAIKAEEDRHVVPSLAAADIEVGVVEEIDEPAVVEESTEVISYPDAGAEAETLAPGLPESPPPPVIKEQEVEPITEAGHAEATPAQEVAGEAGAPPAVGDTLGEPAADSGGVQQEAKPAEEPATARTRTAEEETRGKPRRQARADVRRRTGPT